MDEIIFAQCVGFDWDEFNLSQSECEQLFFNEPLLLFDDLKHSKTERRFYVLGATDVGRRLFVAFTIRRNLVRVISARNMSQKEKKIYEEA